MNRQDMIDRLLDSMRSAVDPSSRIELLLGSILMAEIRLKDQPPVLKEAIFRKLNEGLKLINEIASIQMVLAVLDDDNDRYVNLLAAGIDGERVNTDEWAV